MMAPMVDRNSQQFKRGIKEESKEHPHFSKHVIEELVTDHLTVHPFMYKKRG